VSSTRLISFTQRAIAAIEYAVEPLDGAIRAVVQSELVTNEQLPRTASDPRAAAVSGLSLAPEACATATALYRFAPVCPTASRA